MAKIGEEAIAQNGDDKIETTKIIEARYNLKITEISILEGNTEIKRHQITIATECPGE